MPAVEVPRVTVGEVRLSSFAGYWPRLSRQLGRYDVVNLHGPVPTVSDVFLALSYRRRTRVPLVYTHHPALDVRGAPRLSRFYDRAHVRLAVQADLTLTTSQYYADLHRRHGVDAVEVVPWGVDLRRPMPWRGPRDRRRTPARCGSCSSVRCGPTRVSSGSCRPCGTSPGWSLTLVGRGPNLERYRRMATGRPAPSACGRSCGLLSGPELPAGSPTCTTSPAGTPCRRWRALVLVARGEPLYGFLAGLDPGEIRSLTVEQLSALQGCTRSAADVDPSTPWAPACSPAEQGPG